MKYFCVSDIHSHFNELEIALKQSNFDILNPNHRLIVIGDLFDRGTQTVELLEYVYDLYQKKKAIFIMGNHDKYLLDFLSLNFEKTVFNFLRNGHQTTIEQLLLRSISVDDDFSEYALEINNKYPYLRDFLSSFLPFYELKQYLFVHGGVDTSKEDFKNDSLHTFMWTRMIDKEPLKDRIMVVGHTPAFYVRSLRENIDIKLIEKDPCQYKNYFEVLDDGNLVHIDGGVYSGGKINVHIIEI